jgi:hypothetical protein
MKNKYDIKWTSLPFSVARIRLYLVGRQPASLQGKR